jgi:vancomycin resistance protein VanW
MIIWTSLKRLVRIWLRELSDLKTGEFLKFARSKNAPDPISTAHCLSVAQAIRPGESLENKLINLQLACKAIDGLIVLPGEIFSFWKLVGAPTQGRGYRSSRNIVKGQLNMEVGGGLCQVSGIVYQLGLTAGLSMKERHAHSLDIYTEAERVAPLGADATVVYGYKDLRWVNPFHFPLVLKFELSRTELVLHFFSPQPILPKNIVFRTVRVGELEKVETLEILSDQVEQVLDVSLYKQLRT